VVFLTDWVKNKCEKKLARLLIDKGVETEFKNSLEEVDKIIAEWKKGGMDNRAAYYKMFKKVKENDEWIAGRYDGMTGGRYLLTVASIYVDGQITAEDIEGFSEQTKAVLNKWAEINKE